MRAACGRGGGDPSGTSAVKVTLAPEIPNQLSVEKVTSPGISAPPGFARFSYGTSLPRALAFACTGDRGYCANVGVMGDKAGGGYTGEDTGCAI
jgi:hypothetical protein